MKFKQKILSSVLSIGLIASSMFISNANTHTTKSLSDIKGHWAESAIIDFVSKGYICGYSDSTFKPNNNITRAEFVTIVNNYFGLTKSSGKVYSDTKNHWAKSAIDIAVTNGVCKGVSATEFKPNDAITREQVAVMLSNYKKLTDTNHEEIYKFKDKDKISSWAKDSVEGVVERSYMRGYSDSTFKPKNNITRAEAVSTLSRVHKGDVPPIINTPLPDSQPSPEIDQSTVYVTPSGKSYHKTNDCTALKRSKEILSMTLKEAKSKGKSDPCNLCVK
nr:S-layer homology domain-containing protein [uncultured Romboutsia sp.]